MTDKQKLADVRAGAELETLLKAAASYKMTPEEIFEQKVSFVYGQMMDCAPHITKEQVRARLMEGMGKP